jgi:pimeloyl-ACP methyl ester carboxylesterase
MSDSARLTSYVHDGLTFDVTDEGPVDGDPVVLLHGFPERATSWRKVTPILHDAGLRTYAPDQRGYSPGARPRRRRDYKLEVLSADVAALVERIGRPVHLVGHDWGGGVGWTLAATRPELVRTWTAVSVGHPLAFAKSWVTSNQGLKSWYMAAFNLPWLPEWMATSGRMDVPFRKGGMTAEDVERFHTEVLDDGAIRGAFMWYRGIPFGANVLVGTKVKVPTTMVWSDRDVAVMRATAELSRDWMDAPFDFVVLEGVSHWVPTEAPEQLAAAVLARVEATR